MEPITLEDETIDALIDLYLADASDSNKLAILASFDKYFKKYVSILCTSYAVDFNNKDTAKFLRLFMSKDERANDMSYTSAARRVVGFLRRVFSDFTTDDAYDEIVCIFLQHLSRYRPMIASNIPIKQ